VPGIQVIRVVAVALALGGTAVADPTPPKPDPSVEDVGDANLTPANRHHGIAFAVAVGGGLSFGIGVQGAVGKGGGFSARLGEWATKHTLVTVEIAVDALIHRPAAPAGSTDEQPVSTNTAAHALVGAQYYVGPGFWIRGALGWGAYAGHDEPMRGENIQLSGPAGLVGAGVELVRWKAVALELQFTSVTLVSREGLISSNALLLGVAFD
jgi:hypothetical protein